MFNQAGFHALYAIRRTVDSMLIFAKGRTRNAFFWSGVKADKVEEAI
jgi:hypothetical protein